MTPERLAELKAVEERRGLTGVGIKELLDGCEKLLAFKAYVHQRLDAAGVPPRPSGPHSAEGCRIGDRLDLALAAYYRAPAGRVEDDSRI